MNSVISVWETKDIYTQTSIWFSWGKTYKVSGTSLCYLQWSDLVKFCPLDSTHFRSFLLISIMSENWINIYNLCCNAVFVKKIAKLVKNCYFRTLFRQKLGQHGPHPKSSSIFCLEITKGGHRFSSKVFIKILQVLTELWMIFWPVWYFAAKMGHFYLKQVCYLICFQLFS